MNIKTFQDQEKEKYYEYIKDIIIEHIKYYIMIHPYNNAIHIDKNYVIRASGFNSICKLPEPTWIYQHIERHQDRLIKDLKGEGVNLIKVINYETKTKGIFKKTEYKVKSNEFYSLSW